MKKSIESHIQKVSELEIFLRNIREMYSSLPKKIQSTIDKFSARIDFENKEISKIKSMHNEKPDDSNIKEESILESAWKNIGNFNLKTASDFKPQDNQIISVENKFKQYMHVLDEVNIP